MPDALAAQPESPYQEGKQHGCPDGAGYFLEKSRVEAPDASLDKNRIAASGFAAERFRVARCGAESPTGELEILGQSVGGGGTIRSHTRSRCPGPTCDNNW